MDEKYIFLEALAIESAEQREAFVVQACGGDQALRGRIDELLAASKQDHTLIEKPLFLTPFDQAAESLDLGFLEPSDSPGCLGTIGEYECVEVLGHGAAGIVLKAHDPLLNRFVAVKVIPALMSTNAVERQRFLQEARSAAAVSHPHIITIHAVGQHDLIPFLVMECIQGESLQMRIDREGVQSPESIVRIGLQVAEGLAAAHESGLIHRGIKPSNILLENGIERVKITDFGLAMAVDDSSLTYPGLICGTPQYMSPEQARDEPLDQRSDLFSLGCVLYAMCTGRSPFQASSTIATIRRVCDEQPRPISRSNRSVPASLVRIINRSLEKSPDNRFQTSRELADDLRRELLSMTQSHETFVLTASPATISHSNVDRPARSDRRAGSRVIVTTIIAAAAIVFLIFKDQIVSPLRSGRGLTSLNADRVSGSPAEGQDRLELNSAASKQKDITPAGSQSARAQPGQSPNRSVVDAVVVASDRWWGEPEPVKFDPPGDLEFTSADDPFLTSDELTLYFSSGILSDSGNENIVMSTRTSTHAPWSRPIILSSAINTVSPERGPALSSDGLNLLFSRERDGIDLWIAHRESIDSPWSEAQPLPRSINTKQSELEPFLSADGCTILFCRGGFGEDGTRYRIMESNRVTPDAPWSEAVALSSTVNFEFWQGGPHLSNDGLSLLFHSSNGSILCSHRESLRGSWSTPFQVVQAPAAQPWLSPDAQRLYYRIHRADSNRSELWVVHRKTESRIPD